MRAPSAGRWVLVDGVHICSQRFPPAVQVRVRMAMFGAPDDLVGGACSGRQLAVRRRFGALGADGSGEVAPLVPE